MSSPVSPHYNSIRIEKNIEVLMVNDNKCTIADYVLFIIRKEVPHGLCTRTDEPHV